jgi:HSP20 family protein
VALQRWDPLRDLLSLQERMNRLFEESLARTQGEAPPVAPPPAADVFETDQRYVIEIDLPGCLPDQIAMEVTPHEIVLRGARPAYSGQRPERFHRMERAHGAFTRSFRLPQAVRPEGITCRWQDGLLRIEAPKALARGRRPPERA